MKAFLGEWVSEKGPESGELLHVPSVAEFFLMSYTAIVSGPTRNSLKCPPVITLKSVHQQAYLETIQPFYSGYELWSRRLVVWGLGRVRSISVSYFINSLSFVTFLV